MVFSSILGNVRNRASTMSTPVPKPEIHTLADERQSLLSYYVQNFVINDIALATLKRKLERLLAKVNDADPQVKLVYHELAYLAAYRRDPEAVAKYLDLSERFGLSAFERLVTEACCLFATGEAKAARARLEKISLEGTDANQRQAYAAQCAFVGMFHTANAVYSSIPDYSGKLSTACSSASIELDRSGLEDSGVTERIQVAIDFLKRELKTPFLMFDLFAFPSEGILYRLVVRKPPEALAQIDFALDSLMAEIFDEPLDSVLSVGVVPHAPHTVTSAGDLYVG